MPVDLAQNWPFPMTNNSGESIAAELPRCRMIFTMAALLYPPADGGGKGGEYDRVAEASSTAADVFITLGMSMLSYTRLLFSC